MSRTTKLSKMQKSIIKCIFVHAEPLLTRSIYCKYLYQGYVLRKKSLNWFIGKELDKLTNDTPTQSFLVALSTSLRSLQRRGLINCLHEVEEHKKVKGKSWPYSITHFLTYNLRSIQPGEYINYLELTPEGSQFAETL